MSDKIEKKAYLTPEQEQLALSAAAEGKTAKQIRDIIICSQHAFRTHCFNYPIFEEKWRQARQEGLEELADALQTIPDEEKDVLRARLKSENMRWILSKRKPHVYGDRIEVNLNQSIDIAAALNDARNRVLADVVVNAVDVTPSPASPAAAVNDLDDLLS